MAMPEQREGILTDATDARLVARARSGDRQAFDELAVRYYRASYRTARAIVQSHTDAEDAVQDALVHAYVKLHSFRGDAAFGTWLVSITRNQAISRLRSRRRYDRTTVTAPEALVRRFVSRERSPEDIVLHRDCCRHVAQCIETLPATLRDALRLASNGQSYKDIAAKLGTPTGTIKSRVCIARRVVSRRLLSQDTRLQRWKSNASSLMEPR